MKCIQLKMWLIGMKYDTSKNKHDKVVSLKYDSQHELFYGIFIFIQFMMVQPQKGSNNMGQAGLCSVSKPQTDSLSPFPSTESTGFSLSSNGTINDVQSIISSLLSNVGELNAEEILLKLRYVVNENLELKETISQNNLALRQQLNLLVQWNLQVEQQQKQFRQTINELNKNVSSLQQENHLMRSTLSSCKTSSSSPDQFREWDVAIQNLNKQLEEYNIKLQKVLEENETLLTQKIKLEGEVTLLKCDLTAQCSRNEQCNLKLQENAAVILDLRHKLHDKDKILADPALKGSSLDEQETVAILLQELQDTRNKIEFLESELKVSKEDVVKYKAKYNEIAAHEAEHSIPVSPSAQERKLDDPEKRRLKDEAAMLREEVDTLEAALAEERKRTSDERAAVNRMHSEMARLKKELQESRDKSERNEYNDQYYQAKIKSIHEQHDEATAKLVSYEELLGTKNDEIARLKRDLGQIKAQLVDFKSEGETIAVLRAQVEVYQSDFRAEREAREALATDREKLRDELRHLHTRNTQLVDELETYQRRNFNQRSPRAGSEEANVGWSKEVSSLSPESLWENLSSASDKKEEDPKKKDESLEVDENLLYCPKCNKSFVELRPLEEHVNRCLDED